MEMIELAPDELLGPLNDVERKNAPRRLWVAGDRGILVHGPRVSIVGSRKPSAPASGIAREIAGHLAGRGVVVGFRTTF